MKNLIYGFFMAWGMFLAIPCPFPRWREEARVQMSACLPLIGGMLGGLWALLAWGLGRLSCPPAVTALLLAAFPWLCSGFIHLDGFMDVCDAVLSRRDLEQRLIQKGEDPGQAKAAVAWMSDLKLVDDRVVAEQVVSHCIAKGYGLSRAKQALYEKKVPKEFWEEALSSYPDQTEKILTFLQSRLGGDYDQKDVRKAVDALLRRGHSYGQIREALRRLQMNEDDFLED